MNHDPPTSSRPCPRRRSCTTGLPSQAPRQRSSQFLSSMPSCSRRSQLICAGSRCPDGYFTIAGTTDSNHRPIRTAAPPSCTAVRRISRAAKIKRSRAAISRCICMAFLACRRDILSIVRQLATCGGDVPCSAVRDFARRDSNVGGRR